MKYILLIALSFLGLQGMAQAAEQSDPEATKLLDNVSAKYQTYKSLEATFTLDIEVPGQDKISQKGTLAQEGEKFRLDMADQVIASDGESNWIYLPQNKEIQINDTEPGDDTGLLTPSDLLKQYKKGDYLYALTNVEREGKKTLLQVEFKPVDKASDYFKIRLSIDKKTNQIYRIKAFAKDGARYSFTVTKFTPNKTFAAKHFQLDPKDYDGVHVEDLRF